MCTLRHTQLCASCGQEDLPSKQVLVQWKNEQDDLNRARYGSHLYSGRALQVQGDQAGYTASARPP